MIPPEVTEEEKEILFKLTSEAVKDPTVQAFAYQIGETLNNKPLPFCLGVVSILNLALRNHIREMKKETGNGIPSSK